MKSSMHRAREKDNYKSREVKRLKECALALRQYSKHTVARYGKFNSICEILKSIMYCVHGPAIILVIFAPGSLHLGHGFRNAKIFRIYLDHDLIKGQVNIVKPIVYQELYRICGNALFSDDVTSQRNFLLFYEKKSIDAFKSDLSFDVDEVISSHFSGRGKVRHGGVWKCMNFMYNKSLIVSE